MKNKTETTEPRTRISHWDPPKPYFHRDKYSWLLLPYGWLTLWITCGTYFIFTKLLNILYYSLTGLVVWSENVANNVPWITAKHLAEAFIPKGSRWRNVDWMLGQLVIGSTAILRLRKESQPGQRIMLQGSVLDLFLFPNITSGFDEQTARS